MVLSAPKFRVVLVAAVLAISTGLAFSSPISVSPQISATVAVSSPVIVPPMPPTCTPGSPDCATHEVSSALLGL